MAKSRLKTIDENIAIYLPASLVAEAREKLETEREIELEIFLAIYLRMICRTKTYLHLEDKLPFGKYVGEVVENICRIDPAYIAWLIGEGNGRTKFDPSVLVLAQEMLVA